MENLTKANYRIANWRRGEFLAVQFRGGPLDGLHLGQGRSLGQHVFRKQGDRWVNTYDPKWAFVKDGDSWRATRGFGNLACECYVMKELGVAKYHD